VFRVRGIKDGVDASGEGIPSQIGLGNRTSKIIAGGFSSPEAEGAIHCGNQGQIDTSLEGNGTEVGHHTSHHHCGWILVCEEGPSAPVFFGVVLAGSLDKGATMATIFGENLPPYLKLVLSIIRKNVLTRGHG
jgi:hypothetical protein